MSLPAQKLGDFSAHEAIAKLEADPNKYAVHSKCGGFLAIWYQDGQLVIGDGPEVCWPYAVPAAEMALTWTLFRRPP